jgi:hypothetical protein
MSEKGEKLVAATLTAYIPTGEEYYAYTTQKAHFLSEELLIPESISARSSHQHC